MADVEFEENNFQINRPSDSAQTSGMAAKLIKMGIAKDEKQANYFLLGIVACVVIITLFVLKNA
jgi:hypothetical protein